MTRALEIPLLDTDYGRIARLGFWILAAGCGGFFAWAALAPLDEGVPAPGVVSVESRRKRVEHQGGGIVEKIQVREGDRVRAGQSLLVLNEMQAKTGLNALVSQWRVAAAAEARLRAERQGAREVQFPRELVEAREDADAATAMRAQAELFRARRGALEGELSILRESVRGLEDQIASLAQLTRSRERQVALSLEQIAAYGKLNRDGFISRNQMLEVERQLAELQSRQGEDLSNLAAVRARLAEFRMRGAQREMEYRREVEGQLAEAQKEAATLAERVAAQRDTHERLVVRAPVSGVVVDPAFTVGGVVKPGDRILDIVPEGDELIVEARVGPQYVDRLRPGLAADVHFDAYLAAASAPVVTGKVVVVSADTLAEPRSGAPYYAMRVAVPGEELKKLGALRLQPGMQGTVMVKTGERSLLAYLWRPLARRFTGALSEQ